MTATIVIDDGTNPPASGSTDLAVSFVGDTFTVSNFDNTGILGWRWTLLDRPIGSATALTSGVTATSQFTPDIPGSYLVRLQTYTDVPATILDDADEQVAGIRFGAPFNWLIPAAGETVQQDPNRGWAEAREEMIRSVQSNLWPTPTAIKVGAYTATPGDLVFYNPTGGTFQIDAPLAPVVGNRFAVKNTTVDVTVVTITGNGNSIENPATSTIVANYTIGGALVSIDYIFDGTNWVIL